MTDGLQKFLHRAGTLDRVAEPLRPDFDVKIPRVGARDKLERDGRHADERNWKANQTYQTGALSGC
jgi:hypothetical protein